jgi:6-phosphogluconate dehydrogenase
MKIAVIGLGRMGMAIAHRLVQHKHTVVGYDPNPTMQTQAKAEGVHPFDSLTAIAQAADIFWLMVPAGQPVDDVLTALAPHLTPNAIVIDGGNSFFKDSVRRHQLLATKNIQYLDCGTSGGLHGKEIGFSLMVGGNREAFEAVKPILHAIATTEGCLYVGPSGSGHFVKMVHNGIEYGLLQAYAEGFHLIKDGPYKDIDLAEVAHVWNHGAIIRSWICELAETSLKKDQDLTDVQGSIGENKTGRWTVDTAQECNVPLPIIQKALDVRAWSRETGGNYATKLVAVLRNAFGGHAVGKK